VIHFGPSFHLHKRLLHPPQLGPNAPGREMSSPASNGSVHILVSASRALLAWILHRPGEPELSASSMSRLSSRLTSPTMMRYGG
jgi:hypothetical protein